MRELRSRRGEEWGAPELRPGGVRLRTLTKRGHGQAEHRRPEPGCPVGMWRSWDSGGGHGIEGAGSEDVRQGRRGGRKEGGTPGTPGSAERMGMGAGVQGWESSPRAR